MAVESQLTISPPYRSAIASASALFPVAVGPSTPMTNLPTAAWSATTRAGTRRRRTRPAGSRGRAAASESCAALMCGARSLVVSLSNHELVLRQAQDERFQHHDTL